VSREFAISLPPTKEIWCSDADGSRIRKQVMSRHFYNDRDLGLERLPSSCRT
jgi:hypothetical protein